MSNTFEDIKQKKIDNNKAKLKTSFKNLVKRIRHMFVKSVLTVMYTYVHIEKALLETQKMIKSRIKGDFWSIFTFCCFNFF